MPFASHFNARTARSDRAEPHIAPHATPRTREPLAARPAPTQRAAAMPPAEPRAIPVASRQPLELTRVAPRREEAETPALTLDASERLIMSGSGGASLSQRRGGGMLGRLALGALLLLAAIGAATLVHTFQGLLGH